MATAGAIYTVYHVLPKEAYFPAAFAVVAVVGAFVYIILSRIVEL